MRTWLIGTGAECDVRVSDDPYVSTRHCRVVQRDDGTVWVEDLGSVNGTYVRPTGLGHPTSMGAYGVKVCDLTRVKPPCVLRVGHTEFPWV